MEKYDEKRACEEALVRGFMTRCRPAVADEGFSARVCRRILFRRTALRLLPLWLPLAGMAAVSPVLDICFSGGFTAAVGRGVLQAAAFFANDPGYLAAGAVAAVSLLSVLVVAAVRRTDRQQGAFRY